MGEDILLKPDGYNNGYGFRDLGLPSGILWATCNVGADKPEDPGLLFQFGRINGYKYRDKNHKFSIWEENEEKTGNKYINKTTSGTEYKNEDRLKLEDDAAHVNMSGDWIMPTKDDLYELYNNTEKTLIDNNGMLFISKINRKSIFIPLSGSWNQTYSYNNFSSGYVWSSDVDFLNYLAWNLDFYSDGECAIGRGIRMTAIPVRGVIK